ncbi:hypothetical protein MHSWG343_03320 [Candidatus Mycoplasma haematohominis]|uniref:Uncharacterized protein n=1 Tax=Candidatus Mycoplasma haematohominis TaxID=1494318 RepID=A0A478FPN5_9MOLU|nr:hypothetical protein MHSWG343_03320 [Candidatus Mycoplasma haemohominis]
MKFEILLSSIVILVITAVGLASSSYTKNSASNITNGSEGQIAFSREQKEEKKPTFKKDEVSVGTS